jgi:phosphate uptake regulator/aminoglycoside phosphotransferase (APT) family kinase protein
MRINKSISENLNFLVVEVAIQVEKLADFLGNSSPMVGQRILDRSGYAYNLMLRIHDGCLGEIARRKKGEVDVLFLRAVEDIATDLQRIAELSRDCVHQMAYLKSRRCLNGKAYAPMLRAVGRAIELIERTVIANDTALALEIGRAKEELDRRYRKLMQGYIQALKKKKHTEDLIAALFVAHAVEQMGDALLNISESIISANLGQPMNTERYHSLKASVAHLEGGEKISDLVVERVAETRSGSGISGIGRADRDESEGYVAIFKDGEKRKLKEEKEGVESWHQVYPGLAPRILAYRKKGQSASLLIEHLDGLTFEQILLHEPQRLLGQTLKQLHATLLSVWRETHTKQPVRADYMGQLAKRLPEVYAVHPEFRQSDSRICALKVTGFSRLLKQARDFESRLSAPFSVYIHGDFNVDNILYDPLEKRINFIDLHRSCYMDYVQDVSVFMVSNYRLQILDLPVRRRIARLAQEFCDFARAYARKRDDETFELRLALGLARSFVTSTRFILDRSLAEAMFLRGRYLIERVLAADPKKPAGFRLPIGEIFVG